MSRLNPDRSALPVSRCQDNVHRTGEQLWTTATKNLYSDKRGEVEVMTIEITKPEVQALIQQRLQSGGFKNAEDVILHALQSSAPGQPTGADLIHALQSSPYRDIDLEPSRDRLPVRDVAF